MRNIALITLCLIISIAGTGFSHFVFNQKPSVAHISAAGYRVMMTESDSMVDITVIITRNTSDEEDIEMFKSLINQGVETNRAVRITVCAESRPTFIPSGMNCSTPALFLSKIRDVYLSQSN